MGYKISPVKIWRRQKKIRHFLGKEGKIITWTKIFNSTYDFKKQTPYIVAMVSLDSGERLVGQLVDYEGNNLTFNQRVRVVLRKVRKVNDEDVIPYGLKFKLIK